MGTSKYWVLTLLLLFLGLAAFLGVRFWKERTAWPEGLIQANGRIEGDVISVATKFTGRTEKLFVREGDTVSVGQVMVQLDDVQARIVPYNPIAFPPSMEVRAHLLLSR
ncbi:MAG: biotin/lipoyl-binding protein [Nitrospirales bacterium]